MKTLICILLVAFTCTNTLAQAPGIQWLKCLGGSSLDFIHSVAQTADAGYIVAGSSLSVDGMVSGNHGGYDYLVIKLSSSGNIQWQKSFGGSGKDEAFSIQQTSDGGYIIAGSSDSHDGDVTGNHGHTDAWVLKLNDTGSIQWQKNFGGSGSDNARYIQQTPDGGYIMGGVSGSVDGDMTGSHGLADYWVVKLASVGSVEWQKSFGGIENDLLWSLRLTSDGGYILSGFSYSTDGDVTGHHNGTIGMDEDPTTDFWIIKLSSSGSIDWQRSLGSYGFDDAFAIQQTADQGYIIAGRTDSASGDVSSKHGATDAWIIKLSASGMIQWERSLGGNSYDDLISVYQTSDNGYILAGGTLSHDDGDVAGHHDTAAGSFNNDFWVVKLSPSGNILWQKCLGGLASESAYSVLQTTDGGCIVAGATISSNGDVIGNHGNWDGWVVKLSPFAEDVDQLQTNAISVYPNPTTGTVSILGVNKVNVKVCNVLGQTIKTVNGTNEVSIAELPAGVYYLQLTNESGEYLKTGKIIKE